MKGAGYEIARDTVLCRELDSPGFETECWLPNGTFGRNLYRLEVALGLLER